MPPTAPPQTLQIAPTATSAAPYTADDVLRMTNQYRASQGLKPVVLNPLLSKAALAHAQDLDANDYWAHDDPKTGKGWASWIQDTGYPYQYAGENLANGYDSATSTMEAWKKSPEHNKNLTSPNYTDMGAAVIPGTTPEGKKVYYVVQTFGSQKPSISIVKPPSVDGKATPEKKALVKNILKAPPLPLQPIGRADPVSTPMTSERIGLLRSLLLKLFGGK